MASSNAPEAAITAAMGSTPATAAHSSAPSGVAALSTALVRPLMRPITSRSMQRMNAAE